MSPRAAPEPGLLSLHGAIAPDILEAAVDVIADGGSPGWHIVHDDVGIEMVRERSRAGQPDIITRFGVGAEMVPAHVWVLVLEEEGSGRRTVLKFQLVGSEDEPLWLRIPPDASLPAPGIPS